MAFDECCRRRGKGTKYLNGLRTRNRMNNREQNAALIAVRMSYFSDRIRRVRESVVSTEVKDELPR